MMAVLPLTATDQPKLSDRLFDGSSSEKTGDGSDHISPMSCVKKYATPAPLLPPGAPTMAVAPLTATLTATDQPNLASRSVSGADNANSGVSDHVPFCT